MKPRKLGPSATKPQAPLDRSPDLTLPGVCHGPSCLTCRTWTFSQPFPCRCQVRMGFSVQGPGVGHRRCVWLHRLIFHFGQSDK